MILPFIIAGFVLCFVDEMIRLTRGCYCRPVMISSIVTGTIQIVLSIIILKVLPLWNMNFTKEIKEVFDMEFSSSGDLLHYWGTDVISNIILAGVIVITLIEMGVTIYKTLRYAPEQGMEQ